MVQEPVHPQGRDGPATRSSSSVHRLLSQSQSSAQYESVLKRGIGQSSEWPPSVAVQVITSPSRNKLRG